MNKYICSGRIGKPISFSKSGKMAFTTIAVEDNNKDAEGNKTTSWINLKFLGEKQAQFADKYLQKGTKIIVEGSLDVKTNKTDNGYETNVYVIVEKWEFAESKGSSAVSEKKSDGDGFMDIPTGVADELPFM